MRYFIIAVLAMQGLRATSYFVTQAGAGSHNGTVGNEWSVANYNASSAPTGGDTVSFSGTITSQVVIGSSGTSAGSKLTLDFSAATIAGSSDPKIDLAGKNYFILLGGTIASASGSPTLIACNSSGGHDFTIKNWTYTGPSGGTATFIDYSICNTFTLESNTIDNVAGFMGNSGGAVHDIIVRNNYARTSVNTTTQTDVITLPDSRVVLIEGNMLINRSPGDNGSGQHNDVIQTFHSGSGSAQDPSAWTVRYNWIALSMGSATFRTGDNSWMQLESIGNASGFAMKIYGNVFVGEGTTFAGNNGMGEDSHGIAATAYVYNNTMIRKNGPDRTVGWISGGTLNMRNNILMATAGQDSTDVDVSGWTAGAGGWDYNFWYHLDGAVTANSSGAHGSTSTDPLFSDYTNDDFTLQSGSTLRNAADNTIGSEFNQGIAYGATWPNPTLVTRVGNWDIGAFQSAANIPVLTTTSASSITQTTASSGGNISSDGGDSVTARGVCRSTSANPTTSDTCTSDGTGTGAFTSSLTGLTAGTLYHIRAYATNTNGTGYGSDLTLTTLSVPAITQSCPLPGATINVAYSQTMTATGNPVPTWDLSAGSLSPLSISSGGVVSGTPTSIGTLSFTLRATNSQGSDTKACTLVVSAAPPISYVGGAICNSGGLPAAGSRSCSYTATVGNLLVVGAWTSTATGTLAISDSLGNTFTTDKTDVGTNIHTILASAPVVTGGSDSITVTLTGTTDTFGIVIAEYAGMDLGSSRVDGTAGATGTATNPSPGAVATANASDLVVSVWGGDNNADGTLTAGAGFTMRNGSGNGTTVLVGGLEDQIVSAAGSYTGSWTYGQASNWAAEGAAYKAAATTAVPHLSVSKPQVVSKTQTLK